MQVSLIVVDREKNIVIDKKIDISGDKKAVIKELNKKYGDLKVKYLHNKEYEILINIENSGFDTLDNLIKKDIIKV